MADARDFTEPYLAIYRTVPKVGPGVCDVCHGAPGEGFYRCRSCFMTARQVSAPIELVVPVSLSRVGEQLHRVLWNYKNGDLGPSRDRHRLQVAATLVRFISRHSECIRAAGEAWEQLTIVPSSGHRPAPHPLEAAIALAPGLRKLYVSTLRRGPEALDHNKASDTGYEATGDVRGMRLLLIDDTFTTGARIQSEASRLRLEGATVVAAVVVARVIKPEFSCETRALWEAAGATPFSFDACCLDTHR